mmetsp:Transcript_37283/g.112732  ORF Transcript_37283/g.112732 Transcript_37283/m.112732 type:complete len:215 (-) Transcript_37283:2022-2666(-)
MITPNCRTARYCSKDSAAGGSSDGRRSRVRCGGSRTWTSSPRAGSFTKWRCIQMPCAEAQATGAASASFTGRRPQSPAATCPPVSGRTTSMDRTRCSTRIWRLSGRRSVVRFPRASRPAAFPCRPSGAGRTRLGSGSTWGTAPRSFVACGFCRRATGTTRARTCCFPSGTASAGRPPCGWTAWAAPRGTSGPPAPTPCGGSCTKNARPKRATGP